MHKSIIVGILLDQSGGNYSIAFSYFAVVLVIALLIIFSLVEAKPKATEHAVAAEAAAK